LGGGISKACILAQVFLDGSERDWIQGAAMGTVHGFFLVESSFKEREFKEEFRIYQTKVFS